MEFKDIVMKRYATKKFDGKTIPEEKIKQLKELIRFAPSSFNMQTWKIKVVKDKETKEMLLPAAWSQPQITSCSHLFVFCADKDLLGIIDRMKKEMLMNGAKEEEIKAYIDMMTGFAKNMNDGQMLHYAQNQVFLALANALNGAKALGLDSCPMGGFSPEEFSKILDLPKNLVPTVLCPVGYAADSPREKWRFSSKDIFF